MMVKIKFARYHMDFKKYENVKIKELPYKRYTIEEAKESFDKFFAAAECATDAESVLDAREKYVLETTKHFNTASSLANARFTQNTRDEFYDKEVTYYDEVSPAFSGLYVKYVDYMLSSPFRKELQEKLGDVLYRTFEFEKASYNDIIEEDVKLENSYSTEYVKLLSTVECDFKGEKKPLSYVRGFMEDKDRETRKAAAESIGKAMQAHAAEFDDVFDRLVKVRDKMAKKMGYKNFTELGYYRRGRIDYDRKAVEAFRKNVVSSITPVVAKLKKEVAEKLGIDKFMVYDDSAYSKDEVPVRDCSVEEFFDRAKQMYSSMDKELSTLFDRMVREEAFDVIPKDGKTGGGYCTTFDDFGKIFILANFNGASGDIDVITHEFGHAVAMNYVLNKEGDEVGLGGCETAECHSMSMEFIAWPYMDLFFGNLAGAYRRKHLSDALTFIPYGCIVDEFQHEVYDNPDMTPAQRNQLYLRLSKKYRPYLSYEGIPYLEQGTRWQYQAHIFESPFYYIDYCLAQTVALGFLALSRKDYKLALEKYKEMCKTGGEKFFSQIVKDAGVAYPFGDGTLSNLADRMSEILKTL